MNTYYVEMRNGDSKMITAGSVEKGPRGGIIFRTKHGELLDAFLGWRTVYQESCLGKLIWLENFNVKGRIGK